MLSCLGSATRRFLSGPAAERSRAVVCIGNDAGDLDTIVSALAYAEWMTATAAPDGPLFVPAVPFARADFALRRDALELFRHALGVAGAPEGLLYADEPRVRTAAAAWAPSLGVALTDHNAIGAGVAAVYGDNVVAIVDHHHDERRHCSDDGEGVPGVPRLREIDPLVGSSCSLLVELMGAYLLSCRPLPLCGLLLGALITS